jgi:hypothetical protein
MVFDGYDGDECCNAVYCCTGCWHRFSVDAIFLLGVFEKQPYIVLYQDFQTMQAPQ